MNTYCHVCEKEIGVSIEKLSKSHLKWQHKITARDYYDKFIKSEADGLCVMCNKETRFISITEGYKRTCGHTCGAHLRGKELEAASGVTNVSQLAYVKNLKAETCLNNFGYTTHLKSSQVKSAIKETCKKKYGVDNPSKNEEVKSKRRKTILERYGKDSYAKTLSFRQAQEELGIWTPIEHKSDFEIYRMLVWSETKKWKKILFEQWGGSCAYTKRGLLKEKEFFNHPLYATIDHKTSIFSGFRNGIDPKIIGHLDNLCICSRSANSAKKTMSSKSYMEFLESLE